MRDGTGGCWLLCVGLGPVTPFQREFWFLELWCVLQSVGRFPFTATLKGGPGISCLPFCGEGPQFFPLLAAGNVILVRRAPLVVPSWCFRCLTQSLSQHMAGVTSGQCMARWHSIGQQMGPDPGHSMAPVGVTASPHSGSGCWDCVEILHSCDAREETQSVTGCM